MQKFDYHYNDAFLADDIQFEEGNSFEYGITEPIQNNNLLDSYNFQSKDKKTSFFFPKRVENTLYILALKEFNLESFQNLILKIAFLMNKI